MIRSQYLHYGMVFYNCNVCINFYTYNHDFSHSVSQFGHSILGIDYIGGTTALHTLSTVSKNVLFPQTDL